MTDSTRTYDFEKALNTLKQNPRLYEAILLHMDDHRKHRNLRRLMVYSGFENEEELEEMGLINTFSRGGISVIDRRTGDSIRVNSTSDQRKANKKIIESLKALEAAGIEPKIDIDNVSLEKDTLYYDLLDHGEWLNTVCENVRFERTEEAKEVDAEQLGFLLIAPDSRGYTVPREMKDHIEENKEELPDVDMQHLKVFDRVQKSTDSGVFTTINADNEEQFRWIYPLIQDSELDEAGIGNVLLDIEMELQNGELTPDRVKEVISKYE